MKAFGQTGKCVYMPTTGGVLNYNGVRYCDKPTRYVMAKDEDDNSYRLYDHLCPEHRAIVDALPKGDDED